MHGREDLVALEELKTQIMTLSAQIVSLDEKIDTKDEDIKHLRGRLDEMEKKYGEAIFNMQKSMKEKDVLEDQVQRLRRELKSEKEQQEDLEGKLDKCRAEKKELQAVIDGMEQAAKSSPSRELSCQKCMGLTRASSIASSRPQRGVEERRKRESGTYPLNSSPMRRAVV